MDDMLAAVNALETSLEQLAEALAKVTDDMERAFPGGWEGLLRMAEELEEESKQQEEQ